MDTAVANFTETGLISELSHRNRFDFGVHRAKRSPRSPLSSPLPEASCEGLKLPSDHPAKPPPRFLSTRRRELLGVAPDNPMSPKIPSETSETPLQIR